MPPVQYQQSPYSEPIRLVGRLGVDPVIMLREAAALAGCHPDTLKNEARRGNLALIRVSERRIGVRQSEFDKYLNSRLWAAA